MEAVKKFFSRLGKGTAEMFKRMPFFFYILVHPFQGFYDLKVDPKRRNIPGAVFLFVLLAFSAIFKRQLLGYLYTSRADQLNLDIVVEILVAVLPYLMWVIANWCFTSLMDGDGKLVDIFCATAVGIIPLIICNFIAVPLSNFLSLESSQVYTAVTAFGYVWAYMTIFLGMVVTHQYSVGKGIVTTVLSIVGIMLLAFIILLIFYLVQQVIGFVSQLSTEIAYRMNE